MLTLIIIIVVVVILVNRNNNTQAVIPSNTYDPNIYQNVEKVRALEAKNAELTEKLQAGLTDENADLAELKQIQTDINNNKKEIERLQNEDYARVNQAEASVIEAKKIQDEKGKRAGSTALLYAGSLLLVAGFCGLLGFTAAVNLCFLLIFATIFTILGAILRLHDDEGLKALSNGAFYVVMTLTPFIAGVFCEVCKIPGAQTYGLMMLTIFLVYYFISLWIKTSLANVLAMVTTIFLPSAFVVMLGFTSGSVYVGVMTILTAVYSIIMSFIASSKTLSKDFTSTATGLAITSIAANLIMELTMITTQGFASNFLGTLEIWLVIIAAIIDVVHQYIWAGWMKNRAINTTARISMLLVVQALACLFSSFFIKRTTSSDAIISIVILFAMAAYSTISLFSKAARTFATKEEKDAFFNYELITALSCTIIAIGASLIVSDLCRIVVALLATVVSFILFAISKNYDTEERKYSNALMETSVYAVVYTVVVMLNTALDSLVSFSVDLMVLKWALTLHIICIPVFVIGFTKQNQTREVLSSIVLIFGLSFLANTGFYKSSIIPMLTLLYLGEAVAMTAFGFISKNRNWMGIVGILALLSLIIRYTGQYMLFWFILFGIILLGVAIYSAINAANKKE